MTKNVITIEPGALLEEAAVLMRDSGIGALPVVQDGKVSGIITETNIFDAFIELLGFRDIGSRITIEADDSPGILADISKVIKDFGANITHLAVYRSESGRSDVVIRVNTVNTDEMLDTLKKHGYSIISVIRNTD